MGKKKKQKLFVVGVRRSRVARLVVAYLQRHGVKRVGRWGKKVYVADHSKDSARKRVEFAVREVA